MDLLNDVKRINLSFWSFINIYAFCEMGQMATNQFDEFETKLDECNWYLFEMKLQRIYLMFLANAKQPTTINGYGHIECVRVSLKKVILCVHQHMLNINSIIKYVYILFILFLFNADHWFKFLLFYGASPN